MVKISLKSELENKQETSNTVARLIYSTGNCLFDHVFGGNKEKTIKLLSRLYKKPSGIFSHKFATIAKTDSGIISGIELGYSGSQYKHHYWSSFLNIIKEIHSLRLVKMIKRSFDIEKISISIPKDEYYIAHVAVMPEFRGKGIGNLLLLNSFKKAKKANLKKCCLDVSVDNNNAINLYKKSGFQITRKLSNKSLEKKYGLVGRYRMVKPL